MNRIVHQTYRLKMSWSNRGKGGSTRLRRPITKRHFLEGGVVGSAGRTKIWLSTRAITAIFLPTPSPTLEMSQQDPADAHPEEPEPAPSSNLWKLAWTNNKGVFLIILAQAVGSTMDAIVRFLQQGGHGMHPFQVSDVKALGQILYIKKYLLTSVQVIFARMSMTFLLSSLYMWWEKVPDFPLGKPSVRGWLILRALCGFFGLFCLYCKNPMSFHWFSLLTGCRLGSLPASV